MGEGMASAGLRIITQIFEPIMRPSAQEPRPGARVRRTIVLRTSSWAKDTIDEGSPWLDIDLMISAGDVTSYFEGVEVQYEMRQALNAVPCVDPAISMNEGVEEHPAPEAAEAVRQSCWQSAYEVALT